MTTQTLSQARRIHRQIFDLQRQANTYYSMADAIRRLDPTYQDENVNAEVARLRGIANEFEGDTETLRESIEPHWIDQL
jgi:conjugal transfer/entry exclusion protein